jgi:excisionase family DNA binding protein
MEHLLKAEEAASYLRVNAYTIRRWVREGRLKAHWSGRQYVFTEADLEQFLEPADSRSPSWKAKEPAKENSPKVVAPVSVTT